MQELYKKFMTLDLAGKVLCGIILLLPWVRLFLHPNTGIVFNIPLYYSHISLAETLFIVIFLLTKDKNVSEESSFSPLLWAGFLLWLVTSLITLSATPYFEPALFKTAQFLIHFAFAIALISYLRHNLKVTGIVIPVAILTLILFLPVFWGTTFTMAWGREEFDWVKSLPGFSNVRHMDYILGATVAAFGLMPLAHPRLLRHPSQISAFMAVMLILWVLLFWTGGRGSSIAAFGSLGTCLLFLRPKGWKKLFGLNLSVLITSGMISAFLPIPDSNSYGLLRFMTKVTEVENVNAFTAGRLLIWRETLDVWKASPWLGIGPGQTKTVITAANNVFTHPHNVFLQALMAWGILGGLPFLALIAGSLWSSWRRGQTESFYSPHGICGFAMALALAVNALVDGTFYHPFPIFLFILGIGVALTARPATAQSASSLERA